MTLDEIFATEFFKNTVKEEIDAIYNLRKDVIGKHKINERISHEIKFKSNSFSIISKMMGLNADFLSKEFLLIYELKSKLPSREREWIKGFVGNVILKTIQHYSKLEKESIPVIIEEPVKKKIRQPRKKKESL